MKNTYIIGVIALGVATAFAVMAVDKKRGNQKVVRLKVGGQVVAELRVLDGSYLSLSADQVDHAVETGTTTAKGATTIQFGGADGKGVTVKAEQIEILTSDE